MPFSLCFCLSFTLSLSHSSHHHHHPALSVCIDWPTVLWWVFMWVKRSTACFNQTSLGFICHIVCFVLCSCSRAQVCVCTALNCLFTAAALKVKFWFTTKVLFLLCCSIHNIITEFNLTLILKKAQGHKPNGARDKNSQVIIQVLKKQPGCQTYENERPTVNLYISCVMRFYHHFMFRSIVPNLINLRCLTG